MVVSKVQVNVCPVNMSDPRYLNVEFSQVQGNVSLTNMPDPRHANLVVCQVQGNDHPLLARLSE
jgi:hypothetical protein